MNPKKTRTHVVLVAALALFLTLAPQVALAGNGGGSMQVAGCDVSGNAVTVTVANEAMGSGSGTVVVEVLIGNERASATAQVHLKAGQAAAVSFQFHGTVSDVVLVGFSEQADPIG